MSAFEEERKTCLLQKSNTHMQIITLANPLDAIFFEPSPGGQNFELIRKNTGGESGWETRGQLAFVRYWIEKT